MHWAIVSDIEIRNFDFVLFNIYLNFIILHFSGADAGVVVVVVYSQFFDILFILPLLSHTNNPIALTAMKMVYYALLQITTITSPINYNNICNSGCFFFALSFAFTVIFCLRCASDWWPVISQYKKSKRVTCGKKYNVGSCFQQFIAAHPAQYYLIDAQTLINCCF